MKSKTLNKFSYFWGKSDFGDAMAAMATPHVQI